MRITPPSRCSVLRDRSKRRSFTVIAVHSGLALRVNRVHSDPAAQSTTYVRSSIVTEAQERFEAIVSPALSLQLGCDQKGCSAAAAVLFSSFRCPRRALLTACPFALPRPSPRAALDSRSRMRETQQRADTTQRVSNFHATSLLTLAVCGRTTIRRGRIEASTEASTEASEQQQTET